MADGAFVWLLIGVFEASDQITLPDKLNIWMYLHVVAHSRASCECLQANRALESFDDDDFFFFALFLVWNLLLDKGVVQSIMGTFM